MIFSQFQLLRLFSLLLAAATLPSCQQQASPLPTPKKIFTKGRKFIYEATHFAPDGRLLSRDTIGITCYERFRPGTPCDTNQIKLGLSYDATTPPTSYSGVIDTDTALWSHPPRDGQYRILELSPYPYIKLPARQGQHWTWALGVGPQWGDKQWATWQGDMRITSSYAVTGQQRLATPLGKLPCWVVQAEARCQQGTSALTSFYNPRYGFVRLAYRNLNGSRVTLNMVDTTTVALVTPNEFLPKRFQELGPTVQH